MQAIVLDSGTTPSIRTIETLLDRVRAGETNPIDALDELVGAGKIELREASSLHDNPVSTILDVLMPTDYEGMRHQLFGPRKAPRKPAAQQVEYVGPQGRGKVTFGMGEAIVSRLKPNGSWKVVDRHPWPERGMDCRVNATLQIICGPDFTPKED